MRESYSEAVLMHGRRKKRLERCFFRVPRRLAPGRRDGWILTPWIALLYSLSRFRHFSGGRSLLLPYDNLHFLRNRFFFSRISIKSRNISDIALDSTRLVRKMSGHREKSDGKKNCGHRKNAHMCAGTISTSVARESNVPGNAHQQLSLSAEDVEATERIFSRFILARHKERSKQVSISLAFVSCCTSVSIYAVRLYSRWGGSRVSVEAFARSGRHSISWSRL